MKKTDEYYMKKAYKLASKVKGLTSPNPSVGAIIVKDDKIIGTGYTSPPPGNHAEVVAIDSVKGDIVGSTLYVTLEPCCHYGKTPPCTDKIIKNRVKKVIVGYLDPNPLVAGKGLQILKENGIEVEVIKKNKDIVKLNEDFNFWITNKIPFVTLKYAMTVDGKIADGFGNSKWITGSGSRRDVHKMRFKNDAILVGVGTVLKDNPELTARLKTGKKALLRVILDSKGKTSDEYSVMNDDCPTLFAVKEGVSKHFIDNVKKYNKEIWIDDSNDASINILNLLKYLGQREISSLFVEGGQAVLSSFLSNKLFHKILIYIAPKILGSGSSYSPFAISEKINIENVLELNDVSIKIFKSDIRICAYTDYNWHDI